MKYLSTTCLLIFLAFTSIAQTAQFPIIPNFGGIYAIEDAIERPNPDAYYKILVELKSLEVPSGELNPALVNIARMINLHGIEGVKMEQMDVIVVVHGPASVTLLEDVLYEKRTGKKNPNIAVYQALEKAGVKILVCGQSLIARDLPRENLIKEVGIATSFLTTFTTYEPKGYTTFTF